MQAITPEFMWGLEDNMRVIAQTEYERLTSNLWWPRIAKELPSSSRKERFIWLLDSASIQRNGKGGNIEFEDIVSQTTEIESLNAAAGLELKKEQLEDLDGHGVQLAAHWARQMGAYSAYWPQKCVAQALLDPTAKAYDTKNFFAIDHPVNPYNLSAGTYANVMTGSASGLYPGAVPIHATGSGSVTVEVAINNIAKVIAYVASLKMPNGQDPRFLKLAAIGGPPALTARLQQITNAKFIAALAGSNAGGSTDIESMVRNFGLGQPFEMPEASSAFPNGSDTTYYLLMEEISSNPLGAFTYVNREPFSIVFHGPTTDAQLARLRRFQWTTEGRNNVGTGHPFLIIKCMAT